MTSFLRAHLAITSCKRQKQKSKSLLKRLAKKQNLIVKASNDNNFEIKYTTYDFGVFIDCIGGICGDANHFWTLYENGSMSMVGASDLFLEINDKISWVYTSF